MRIFVLALMLVWVPAVDLTAQNPRLELGRRLKRFELAWETAPTTGRDAAVAYLRNAVGSFFSLRLSEAGRQMDNAWLAVRSDDPPSALTRAVIGSQLLVSPLCAETGDGPLELKLQPFYPTDSEPSPEAVAHLKLTRATGELLAETEYALSQLTGGTRWQLQQIPEGDHLLSVVIRHKDTTFALPPMTVSRISELNRRLKEIKDAAVSLRSESRSSEAEPSDATLAATLRNEKRLMEDVMEGLPQEADFPLLYRLKNCEAMLATRRQPADFAQHLSGSREAWLTLANGRRSVPTRVHLPPVTDEPAPVLFVFHGAGGSENMFFETYGAGRVVREAAQRGWVVVSPRQGLTGLPLDIGEMLDALQAYLPLDRKRIMLLGHSMGASQAVQQVRKHPTLPVATVALGGGGRLSESDAQRSQGVSWFIGAGDQDFGLAMGRQLKRSLTAAECPVRMKVYDNIEHLVVVQAAIDDTFEFLEEVLAKLEIGSPPESR
ncbi:MAG: alpha/beta fold hydrolase [Mariniblastus sp.]|nr:alpha/beta fold hydrolase [Mariniblastus sp.]